MRSEKCSPSYRRSLGLPWKYAIYGLSSVPAASGNWRQRNEVGGVLLRFPVGLIASTLIVLLVFPCSAWAQDGRSFLVGTPLVPRMADSHWGAAMNLLFEEMGRRVGLDVTFVRQPPERSIQSANEGAIDAEGPRVGGLEAQYPGLVPVPEQIITAKFVGFARQDDVFVETWDSLGMYRVAAITGWKFYQKHLPEHADVTWVRDEQTLFELLERGRVDVVLHEHISGCACARSLGLTGVRELSPPLAELPLFLYVNKRHAALAPTLAQALRDIKADGTYERLLRLAKGE